MLLNVLLLRINHRLIDSLFDFLFLIDWAIDWLIDWFSVFILQFAAVSPNVGCGMHQVRSFHHGRWSKGISRVHGEGVWVLGKSQVQSSASQGHDQPRARGAATWQGVDYPLAHQVLWSIDWLIYWSIMFQCFVQRCFFFPHFIANNFLTFLCSVLGRKGKLFVAPIEQTFRMLLVRLIESCYVICPPASSEQALSARSQQGTVGMYHTSVRSEGTVHGNRLSQTSPSASGPITRVRSSTTVAPPPVGERIFTSISLRHATQPTSNASRAERSLASLLTTALPKGTVLYYLVMSSHCLHSLGNYTHRAIFPKMCKISQSSIDFDWLTIRQPWLDGFIGFIPLRFWHSKTFPCKCWKIFNIVVCLKISLSVSSYAVPVFISVSYDIKLISL